MRGKIITIYLNIPLINFFVLNYFLFWFLFSFLFSRLHDDFSDLIVISIIYLTITIEVTL